MFCFPFLPVVFGMGENVADVDYLPVIADHGNEPVFVASDVEHRERLHEIGMREVPPHVGQAPPTSSLGHVIPVQQRLQAIGMLFGKFPNDRLTDDPQILGYRSGNFMASRRSKASRRDARARRVKRAAV
jgi:hypothetical protein